METRCLVMQIASLKGRLIQQAQNLRKQHRGCPQEYGEKSFSRKLGRPRGSPASTNGLASQSRVQV
jgi:hypothetical protein